MRDHLKNHCFKFKSYGKALSDAAKSLSSAAVFSRIVVKGPTGDNLSITKLFELDLFQNAIYLCFEVPWRSSWALYRFAKIWLYSQPPDEHFASEPGTLRFLLFRTGAGDIGQILTVLVRSLVKVDFSKLTERFICLIMTFLGLQKG